MIGTNGVEDFGEEQVRVLFQREVGSTTIQACISSGSSRYVFVRCLRDGKPSPAEDDSWLSITVLQTSRDLLAEMVNAFQKWDKIQSMQKVCISDAQMDILLHYFSKEDGAEADLFFKNLVSIPNPQQIGTIKTYLAWLRN